MLKAADIFGPEVPSLTQGATREFQCIDEGHYSLTLPQLGVVFSVDRLRRKWDELIGELTVRCDLSGAQTFDGVLSVGDFNLSTQRAREERARYLSSRSKAPDVDWAGLLEEFVQRVLTAERAGQPAVSLRDLPRPSPDDSIDLDGVRIIDKHPMVLFGDGGTFKSYLALYFAGRLSQQGIRAALFDWELSGEDHRDRLERVFGADMPDIPYVRCSRPLVHEVDRLRRVVREQDINYAIFDSIAFACDGAPEAAEVAGRYFQAVRQLGIGSLHVAHVNKSVEGDQKPFGSAFWHNGARSTWNVKQADAVPGTSQINIGLYNRKANLGPLQPAVGFEVGFTADRTTVRRVQVADVADLAGHLSVRQRMAHLLRKGALSPDDVAEEITADPETVRRIARRYKQQFTVVPGGKLALLETRRAS
ncbi:MAG TPA: AAA family ATPase [Gemmatimonadaceae bacterium]|nr:AAA family ATPase [Gemmatimonadaceae bacterium]